MSTKTLRKRIALVAVSAMGFGLLTSVSANAGEAAAGAPGVMLVSGSICSATTLAGGTTLTAADGATADASPYESGATEGRVLTVPAGGSLNVAMDTGDILQLKGTSLGIGSLVSGTTDLLTATSAVNTAGNTYITAGATDQSVTLTAVAVGQTTLVIDTASATATATNANKFVVNVVAACTSGTFDAASSYIELQTTDSTANDNTDDATQFANDATAYLAVAAKNAYGTAVPSGTFIASATNGALVGIASAGTPTCGDISMASVTAAGTDIRVAVCQPTDNAPLSTVVTVTYGSTVVATKAITITGDLAKIEVSSVIVARTNDQDFKAFKTRTFDSAGNQIVWTDAALTVTGTDSNVTAADAGITIIDDYQWATNYVTCASGAKGTTELKVKGLKADNTYLYSDAFKVTCSNTAYTWSVSMDKSSYVPGDIATVTISAKDVNGNVVADAYDTDNAGAAADAFSYVYGANGTAPSVSGSNLTAVVAPASGDYFSAGKKTYKFTVGSTEGSYNLVVDLAGITTDSAKTVGYTIKSSSATVTNAEVLAAIVKLIASINKQIAALQKALKK